MSSAETWLLERLPDLPRWIEARAMVLSGKAAIFGQPGAEGSLLIAHDRAKLTVAVGRPQQELLDQALARTASGWTMLAPFEERQRLAPRLSAWSCERASLHCLVGKRRLSAGVGVQLLDPSGGHPLAVPEPLRGEIEWALERGQPVAVAKLGNQEVSFCYVAWETECLWDVAVETLEPYRGQGFAASTASWLIRYMERLGKLPVWGATESNRASLALAARLGFRQVDELAVFTRLRTSPTAKRYE